MTGPTRAREIALIEVVPLQPHAQAPAAADLALIHRALADEPSCDLLERSPEIHVKGLVHDVITSASGPAAVMGLTRIVLEWLRKRPRGSVVLRRRDTPQGFEVEISGTGVTIESVESAIESLLNGKPAPGDPDGGAGAPQS